MDDKKRGISPHLAYTPPKAARPSGARKRKRLMRPGKWTPHEKVARGKVSNPAARKN